jgi:hypothetical protein
MSIINDALKKTQTRLQENKSLSPPGEKKSPRLGFLFFLFGLVGCGLWVLFFVSPGSQGRTKQASLPKEPPASTVISQLPPEPQKAEPQQAPAPIVQTFFSTPSPPAAVELTINGIIEMDGELIALINNKIVKEGDEIDGKRIVKITSESVEILDNGNAVTLTTKD